MNQHDLERTLRDAVREQAPPDYLVGRVRQMVPGPLAAAVRALLEQARSVVAQIRLDTRTQPALVGFRGRSQNFQLLAVAGQHEVFVQVTPSSEITPDAGRLKLRGQIESTTALSLSCDIAATAADGPLYTTRAHDDGSFELMLPSGRYDLAIGLDPPFLVPGLELV
jgi:hypothetical protein